MSKTLEKLLKEEEVNHISIHYYPGTELYVSFDGNRVYSTDISRQRFEKLCALRKRKAVEEMKTLLIDYNEYSDELIKLIVMKRLFATGDFTVKGNQLFITGISHPLPAMLVDQLINLAEQVRENLEDHEDYLILKNFWAWVKDLYLVSGKKDIFQDEFVQTLLEGYQGEGEFFKECLKDKSSEYILKEVMEVIEQKKEVDLTTRIRSLN